MPFDPTIPQPLTPLDADQIRAQLNALHDEIETIPQGPAGPEGPVGPPFAGALVDGVTGLPYGAEPTVSLSFDGVDVHFSFGIPAGAPGADGGQGPAGETGPQGVPGPPFATAEVASVTTLPPDENATVSLTYDGSVVHFSFGIPRGATGAPGEVTTAALDTALAGLAATLTAGSSANTNGVSTLDAIYTNPESEELRQKLNELILAARR